ncbi:hypothetical protein FOMPIDRAFT_149639 [Fomitopsis schrenkii]|uniref:Uncharacterized protein n=1 Tax=Fomitopsis schrenkii TaxID=2126942 RepID=S8DQH9_FOMSC|nr:hypothetical protein FOMPIDRAFT_149639 [Fomitopsis schrenkii]
MSPIMELRADEPTCCTIIATVSTHATFRVIVGRTYPDLVSGCTLISAKVHLRRVWPTTRVKLSQER